MIRTTTIRTMKVSSILNLKSWTSKIHPPLPRTPRESQQLLSMLTSSFRRQLDKQHPPVETVAEELPSSQTTTVNSKEAAPHDLNSSAASAHAHVKSILEHPLFNVVPSKDSQPLSGDTTKPVIRHVTSRHDGWMAANPMACLEERIAAGTATAHAIANALNAQMWVIRNTPGLSLREGMRKSRAGSKAVSWFHSTDPASRNFFFNSANCLHAIMPFLMVENLRHIGKQWLQMLYDCNVSAGEEGRISLAAARWRQRKLLESFIDADLGFGEGLKSSLEFFFWAVDSAPKGAKYDLSREDRSPLFYAGLNLAHFMVRYGHHDSVRSLPPKTMDRFLCLSHIWSRDPHFWSSTLHLYHPSRPTAGPALEFARRLATQDLERLHPSLQMRRLKTILVAAQLLLEQNRNGDAAWLLKHAKDRYPTLLTGKARQDKTSNVDIGPEYLSLLSRLDIGMS